MTERTGLFKQRYSRFFTLRAPCGRCLRFLTVASARTIGSHQVHPLRARYKKGPPLASLFLYLWRSGRDSNPIHMPISACTCPSIPIVARLVGPHMHRTEQKYGKSAPKYRKKCLSSTLQRKYFPTHLS
jgi:hypothetical protein